MNASSKLSSALFCKTSISVRAREFRESWVARRLVAANISSARRAGVPKPPDEKFEHLAQSRCITAALAWRNQNKRGTTR